MCDGEMNHGKLRKDGGDFINMIEEYTSNGEIWKDVIGYEGLYKVSNFGNIYTYYKNRIMNPHVNAKTGYKQVYLAKDGITKGYLVHRLVAIAFAYNDDPDNKEFVNHIDEVKTNNVVTNLEWCTKQYNNTYRDKIQKSSKWIIQLSKDLEFIKLWKSAREASRVLGIQYRNISAVAIGKRNSCGGYRWRFKEEMEDNIIE